MPLVYSVLFGATLGIGSVFMHASLPPYGLFFALTATCTGIWSIGRIWGGRKLRVIASLIWMGIVLRAGFPGVSQEHLVEGSAIGISLINGGFLILLLAVLLPT